jgi:hypothetical protein
VAFDSPAGGDIEQKIVTGFIDLAVGRRGGVRLPGRRLSGFCNGLR